jgi:hypothetical protein
MAEPETPSSTPALSRRGFLCELTLGAAAATCCAPHNSASAGAADPPEKRKLSTVAEAQLQALLARRGKQFTEAQKEHLRRLVADMENASHELHEFPLDDNSEPALIFRVWRKEK